jgi:hypothetical protein
MGILRLGDAAFRCDDTGRMNDGVMTRVIVRRTQVSRHDERGETRDSMIVHSL